MSWTRGCSRVCWGADQTRVAADDQVTGKMLENFVAMEVVKYLGWSTNRVRLYHYQRDREDVDLVLERADGQIVAIEVKARARRLPATTTGGC